MKNQPQQRVMVEITSACVIAFENQERRHAESGERLECSASEAVELMCAAKAKLLTPIAQLPKSASGELVVGLWKGTL